MPSLNQNRLIQKEPKVILNLDTERITIKRRKAKIKQVNPSIIIIKIALSKMLNMMINNYN